VSDDEIDQLWEKTIEWMQACGDDVEATINDASENLQAWSKKPYRGDLQINVTGDEES
jgi:hypothetical protein